MKKIKFYVSMLIILIVVTIVLCFCYNVIENINDSNQLMIIGVMVFTFVTIVYLVDIYKEINKESYKNKKIIVAMDMLIIIFLGILVSISFVNNCIININSLIQATNLITLIMIVIIFVQFYLKNEKFKNIDI